MSGFITPGTIQGTAPNRTAVVCIPLPTCSAGSTETTVGGVHHCCARHDEAWINQWGQGARLPSAGGSRPPSSPADAVNQGMVQGSKDAGGGQGYMPPTSEYDQQQQFGTGDKGGAGYQQGLEPSGLQPGVEPSWFSRNWPWLVGLSVAVTGGLVLTAAFWPKSKE